MSPPDDYSDFLHVVAAVISDSDGRVFIARRRAEVHQGGLWEFPGGKVEPSESPDEALRRELSEEIDIEVRAAEPLITVPYRYPERNVLLEVWSVTDYVGAPRGREGQPVQWVDAGALDSLAFPAANRPIIAAAQLPSSYLITPEPGPQPAWPAFLDRLDAALQRGTRLVQLRAKTLSDHDYRALAERALALCRHYGAWMLVNGSPEMAAAVGADGVHLTGERLMGLTGRPVATGRWLGVSCHSAADLARAAAIGADFAVLSAICRTESHPEAAPLGWERFAQWVRYAPLPVYALGGVGEGDIDLARRSGGQGIAAIRALWG